MVGLFGMYSSKGMTLAIAGNRFDAEAKVALSKKDDFKIEPCLKNYCLKNYCSRMSSQHQRQTGIRVSVCYYHAHAIKNCMDSRKVPCLIVPLVGKIRQTGRQKSTRAGNLL
jgi:hypothetical protein